MELNDKERSEVECGFKAKSVRRGGEANVEPMVNRNGDESGVRESYYRMLSQSHLIYGLECVDHNHKRDRHSCIQMKKN